MRLGVDVRDKAAPLSYGRNRKDLVAALLLLIVPNILAWIIFYPGYFQADHQAEIAKLLIGKPSQWHSVIWQCFALPFVYFSPSIAVYGLVQVAVFVLLAIYSLRKLQRARLIGCYWKLSLLYGIFPTFLLYNQLYASDMLFSYLLMAFTAWMIEYAVASKKGEKLRLCCIIQYCLLLLALVLLRKNAVIIPITLVIVFIASKRQIILSVAAVFVAALALISSFCIGLFLEAEPSPSQEFLSVPSTQIAYVFANDGYIPEECLEYFTSIRTDDEWAQSYQSFSADNSKWGLELSSEFIANWIALGLNNPGMYLMAYIDLEYPFWQITCGENNWMGIDFANYGDITLSIAESTENNINQNYLDQFEGARSEAWSIPGRLQEYMNGLHIPIVTDFFNLILFNRALPFWVILCCLVYLRVQSQFKRKAIAFVPVAVILLSFLLFAPVALMRYSIQLYYSLPLLIWLTVNCRPEVGLMGRSDTSRSSIAIQ